MTAAIENPRIVRPRRAARLARSADRGRNPGLDGLRGLALLGMLAWHAEVGWVRGGFARMTIFFVLSGYLAAASYLRMTAAGAGYGEFWRRRTVRLLPVTVLGVVVAMAVTVWIGTVAAREQLRGDVLSVLTYTSNWRFISDERAYGELFERPSALMHYWSLSIEEQSFLLLPLVLGLAALVARRRPLARIGVVAALAVLCASIPWFVPHSPDAAYFGTHVRFGEFLVGVLLALLLDRTPDPSPVVRRGVAVAGSISLVLLLAVMLTVDRELGWLYRGGMGLFAVPAVLVVAALVLGAPRLQRVLSVRPLVSLGVWALSVYVLHWPIFLVLAHLLPGVDHAVLVVIQLAVAVALGALVHRVFERPLMPGGAFPTRRVLSASAVAVVAVAVVAVLLPVPEDPYAFEEVALEQAEGRNAGTTVPVPPEVTTVAVFGGSSALMLSLGMEDWMVHRPDLAPVPGFADLGCALVDDARRFRDDGIEEFDSGRCGDWRADWPAAVRDGGAEVALVVLGVWDTLDLLLPGRSDTVAVGDPVADREIAERLDRVVVLLSAAGARRVVFATTPVVPERVWRDRGIPADHPQRVRRFNELLAELAARHEQVTVFDYAGYVERLDPATHERLFPDGVHPTWHSSIELWNGGDPGRLRPPTRASTGVRPAPAPGRPRDRGRRGPEPPEDEVAQAQGPRPGVEDQRPGLRAPHAAHGLHDGEPGPHERVVPPAHLLDQQERVAGLEVVDDRHARPDVQVLDPGAADQPHRPASCPGTQGEVGLLAVGEVALVEQAHLLQAGAPQQHEGAVGVVDGLPAGQRTVVGWRGHGHAAEVGVDHRDHAVPHVRAHQPGHRLRVRRVEHRRQAPRVGVHVVGHQPDPLAVVGVREEPCQPHVRTGPEPRVVVVLDQLDRPGVVRPEAVAQDLELPGARGVVHHRDPHRHLPVDQARDGGQACLGLVPVHDHDPERDRVAVAHVSGRSVGRTGVGSAVSPIRYSSTAAAQERPSAIAQTIRLWPRPASPQTNTPGWDVAHASSRATLPRPSSSTSSCSSRPVRSGPVKPIASSTRSHSSSVSLPSTGTNVGRPSTSCCSTST
jgi:peptidoglycan/LPS O-acetylase OafA/YrhL